MKRLKIDHKPVRVAQLVRMNTGKCGPSKWHMVLGLNPATDDILNLLGAGCCGWSAPWGLGPHEES